MLVLKKGQPEFTPVPLGGGGVIHLRAATAFDVDVALAEAHQVAAGLVAGEDAAERAAAFLGEAFHGADFTRKPWIEAAAQRIALIELATLCNNGWRGVALESEGGALVEVPAPTKETLALLLRDVEVSNRFRAVIYSKVNLELAEGNGLPVSPSGGAGTDGNSAGDAGPSAPPVPTGGGATTASAARNTNTLH